MLLGGGPGRGRGGPGGARARDRAHVHGCARVATSIYIYIFSYVLSEGLSSEAFNSPLRRRRRPGPDPFKRLCYARDGLQFLKIILF